MNIWNKDKRSKLEKEIDSVLDCMENLQPDSEEYGKMANQLVKLCDAKKGEKPSTVSPDVKAAILANVGITLIILTYEKTGAITSKVMGYLYKGRV